MYQLKILKFFRFFKSFQFSFKKKKQKLNKTPNLSKLEKTVDFKFFD